MEQLFKLTDLEIRFPLNLNVLDRNNTPRVMDLREALQSFLDHRREVLIRRSTFRLEAIERRLEILEGFLIAYLNIDRLIKIIREEDEPKPVMMKRVRADRHPGRGDPEHAAARVAPAGRVRDQGRAQEAHGRAQGPQGAAQGRQAPVGQDRRADPGDQDEVRRQDQARQAPHRARRRAGRDRACDRGFRRARAGDGGAVGQGLDPRRQGSSRRQAGGRAQVQGRRRGAVHAARPVDRQGAAVRHQRPLLHAGLRPAAERARPRRTGAADDRARQRARHRGALRVQGRPQVPRGIRCRARLHRARGRGRGADQERQAGAEPRRQGDGAGLRRRAGGRQSRSRR